jgi:hypothetical protein
MPARDSIHNSVRTALVKAGWRVTADPYEQVLGQYVLYQLLLTQVDLDRTVYLAVTTETYYDLFQEPLGQFSTTGFVAKISSCGH